MQSARELCIDLLLNKELHSLAELHSRITASQSESLPATMAPGPVFSFILKCLPIREENSSCAKRTSQSHCGAPPHITRLPISPATPVHWTISSSHSQTVKPLAKLRQLLVGRLSYARRNVAARSGSPILPLGRPYFRVKAAALSLRHHSNMTDSIALKLPEQIHRNPDARPNLHSSIRLLQVLAAVHKQRGQAQKGTWLWALW